MSSTRNIFNLISPKRTWEADKKVPASFCTSYPDICTAGEGGKEKEGKKEREREGERQRVGDREGEGILSQYLKKVGGECIHRSLLSDFHICTVELMCPHSHT